VAREPELANRKNVERSGQPPRNLVPDRNAAAGQREDDDVVALGVLEQRSGEQLSGMGAVSKPHPWRRYYLCCTPLRCASVMKPTTSQKTSTIAIAIPAPISMLTREPIASPIRHVARRTYAAGRASR